VTYGDPFGACAAITLPGVGPFVVTGGVEYQINNNEGSANSETRIKLEIQQSEDGETGWATIDTSPSTGFWASVEQNAAFGLAPLRPVTVDGADGLFVRVLMTNGGNAEDVNSGYWLVPTDALLVIS
jgi:hypothetical protein